MNYDILATTAYSAKLIRTPKKTTRRHVIQAIKHRQEQVLNKTINDFPLVCLENATLNRIIDLSVTMEKRLFPDTLNETKHREGFATAVHHKKFCSINARKLLDQDMDWWLFLSSL
jgi:protein-arginine kinase